MRTILFVMVFLGLLDIDVPAFAANVDVDVVYYHGDDTLTYCEVYASVQRATLVYLLAPGDSMFAQFSLITSLSQGDTTFLSDTLDTIDRTGKADFRSSGAYFPYIYRYLLKPGTYDLEIEIRQDSAQVDEWKDVRLDVPLISAENSVSGLALGAELEFNAEPSPFTRNGVRFVPNPSAFYGSGLPMLYYYLECYGLDSSAAASDSLTVTRFVRDEETAQDAKQPAVRKMRIPGASAVIADGFPAYTLRTGTYSVQIDVEAPGQMRRTANKKFYVYRPEEYASGRDFAHDKSFLRTVFSSDDDILHTIDPDSALELMQYVLTKQEIRRVRDMDANGKRRFLIDYWAISKPDDPDAANRHFARVAEANSRYGFLNRAGWRTDRGRILILYGEPDYVDRRYADAAGLDHEIWHYDKLEGGVLFVFVDQSGFGDLNLVHSTKRGEIYNPNALFMQQNQNPASKMLDQGRGLRE